MRQVLSTVRTAQGDLLNLEKFLKFIALSESIVTFLWRWWFLWRRFERYYGRFPTREASKEGDIRLKLCLD